MIGARSVKFIDFRTSAFFDSELVKNTLDKVERRALIMAAVDLKRKAKRSMYARPLGKASPRGMPPFKHKHSRRGKRSGRDYGLERSIMYAYDFATRSAVVGPSTKYGANIADVGSRHEFGGSIVRKNTRRKVRRLGGPGEIRVKAQSLNWGDQLRDAQGRRLRMATRKVENTRLGPVEVTYGKLFTNRQVALANRLNARLYGPAIIHGTYPERRFMQPALQDVAPRMPEYFVKAVK
jgi:phage gpG-like protein